MLKKLATVAATAALLAAVPVSAAQAAPKKGLMLDLVCDNGETYAITSPPADADWTPGILTNGRGTFRPVKFGELTGTFTPADGSAPASFTDDPIVKPGRIPPNADLLNCSFKGTIEESDGTVTLSGTVIGFLTGRA